MQAAPVAGRAASAVEPGTKPALVPDPGARPGNAAAATPVPVAPAPTTAATPANTAPAAKPAAEPTPLESCGKRSLVARWTCMKRECAKPQFIQLAECKEERDRAEREADQKERY
jgi:hypothetical protein